MSGSATEDSDAEASDNEAHSDKHSQTSSSSSSSNDDSDTETEINERKKVAGVRCDSDRSERVCADNRITKHADSVYGWHARTRTDDFPYVCETCSQTFAYNSYLIKHTPCVHTRAKSPVCVN